MSPAAVIINYVILHNDVKSVLCKTRGKKIENCISRVSQSKSNFRSFSTSCTTLKQVATAFGISRTRIVIYENVIMKTTSFLTTRYEIYAV